MNLSSSGATNFRISDINVKQESEISSISITEAFSLKSIHLQCTCYTEKQISHV